MVRNEDFVNKFSNLVKSVSLLFVKYGKKSFSSVTFIKDLNTIWPFNTIYSTNNTPIHENPLNLYLLNQFWKLNIWYLTNM